MTCVGKVEGSMSAVLDGIRVLDFGRYIAGPFGAGGPLSHKHGFDGIGQAMSGAVYLSGTPEQPVVSKVSWVDFGTACLSAFGTLAALIERGKSGRGQKVEGALLRTAIAFANSALIEQALIGVNRTATLNRGFNSAPADIFRTKDG